MNFTEQDIEIYLRTLSQSFNTYPDKTPANLKLSDPELSRILRERKGGIFLNKPEENKQQTVTFENKISPTLQPPF